MEPVEFDLMLSGACCLVLDRWFLQCRNWPIVRRVVLAASVSVPEFDVSSLSDTVASSRD